MVTVTTAEEDPRLTLAGVEELAREPYRLTLAVDTQTISVERVVVALLDRFGIRDLMIENPPLEEVIKAIYRTAPRRASRCRHELDRDGASAFGAVRPWAGAARSPSASASSVACSFTGLVLFDLPGRVAGGPPLRDSPGLRSRSPAPLVRGGDRVDRLRHRPIPIAASSRTSCAAASAGSPRGRSPTPPRSTAEWAGRLAFG